MDDENTYLDQSDELEEAARAVPHLYKHKTLVLNADFQPLSYRPLSLYPWTKIMFWLTKSEQRVKEGGNPIIQVVAEYPDITVRSANEEIPLPSVVAHTEMRAMPKRANFNRYNIYLRDNFTCQYTGKKLPPNELTLDHVIPQSRGGKSSWDNLVACEQKINELKSDLTLDEFRQRTGLKLIREPYEPSVWELREKSKRYPPKFLHESWEDFLYWDAELEP